MLATRVRSGAGRAGNAVVVDLTAYRDAIEWEVRADAVIDALEQLLTTRRGVEVTDFCERAIRLLRDNAAEIRDDDAVRRLAARLDAVHERARRVTR
jgi:hypothetical protein